MTGGHASPHRRREDPHALRTLCSPPPPLLPACLRLPCAGADDTPQPASERPPPAALGRAPATSSSPRASARRRCSTCRSPSPRSPAIRWQRAASTRCARRRALTPGPQHQLRRRRPRLRLDPRRRRDAGRHGAAGRRPVHRRHLPAQHLLSQQPAGRRRRGSRCCAGRRARSTARTRWAARSTSSPAQPGNDLEVRGSASYAGPDNAWLRLRRGRGRDHPGQAPGPRRRRAPPAGRLHHAT